MPDLLKVVLWLTLAAVTAAVILVPLFGRDLVVASEQTALLSQCGDPSSAIATLPPGQPLRLRFAIAGASNRCYSVSAELDSGPVAGYIDKWAVKGLESFEQQRRDASVQQLATGAVRSIQIEPAATPAAQAQPISGDQDAALQAAVLALKQNRPQDAPTILSALPATHRDAAVLRAQAYLQMTRPADAWNALQPAMTEESRDDGSMLGLAGIAAFQQDRIPQARAYLQQSLALEANPVLAKLHEKIKVEERSDQSDEATYGSRFVMRYEGDALPQEGARRLADSFDSEIVRITRQLNCPVNDRLVVVVQALDSYRRTTGAAEWSGGRYDGRIHIAVPPSGEPDAHVRGAFAHEFVHACLARRGSWPSWLHEGLAQQLSGGRLTAEESESLRALQKAGQLPTLAQLGGGWARLGDRQAGLAYALALSAAQVLHQDLQDYGLRELLNQPGRLPDVEKQLDQKLQAVFSR